MLQIEMNRGNLVHFSRILFRKLLQLTWWINIIYYRSLSGVRICVGKGTRLYRGAYLKCSLGSGRFSCGEKCIVHRGAMILPYGGHIELGDNCTLNPYSIIYGHGGVRIGDNVRIAAHVTIIPANHNFNRLDKPICRQGITAKGVIIGNDVWIGANATILDGSSIAEGCVIAAGAVVRGNTVPNGIYGGVPAKLIGRRGPKENS
ncbi:acyltransferase [Pelagibacterium montanilacus]|uniref:acyltransferase n=1 Tax=Pelagibacterium montanilacus TaxID=2185280 RepID=UPI00319E3DE5